MDTPIRIAISGAAGRVGYSLVFRIAAGGMFGSEQHVALSLLELPEAMNRLKTCAMELKDCSFPLLSSLRIGTDPKDMFQDADWVILLGGKPYPRDSRSPLDLLRENAPVMVDHGRAINHSAPTARVLVVTNPCNTNCLIAKSHAQDVPSEHWFAMNRLARMRATAQIAERAGVPVSQVTRVTVWGNYSATAYVDIKNAWIGDHHALEVLDDPEWIHKVLEPTVANRTRDIMTLCGDSPAGSVSQAILGTVRSITSPTPFTRWFGAGVVSDGSYGVPRGLVFGFPLITQDGRIWSIVPNHYIDSHAQHRISQNIAELELEASSVSHLLGKT